MSEPLSLLPTVINDSTPLYLGMRWLALLLLILTLVGCARSSSSTVVNADGSWQRTLKLTVSKAPGGTENGGAEWPDTFTIPSGPGIKVSTETKEEEKTTTITRSGALGDALLTDVIMREKGKTTFKNYVTVREIEPGVYEYYEKLTNPSPDAAKTTAEMEEFRKELRKYLPSGVTVTDEEANKVANKMVISIARRMFGPDDHLFGTLITNPEGSIRRLKLGLAKSLDGAMTEHLGDKLTAEQRKDVIIKMLAELNGDAIKNAQKPSPEKDPTSNTGFVGMSVSVKLPGEIISSNGEIDPYTGEVYWDFLSASADAEALELRAVCRVKK